MAVKTQASMELLLSIGLVLIVTSLVSTSIIYRESEVMIMNKHNIVLNNCEDFNNKAVQVLKLNNMRAGFYNLYNLTIDGEYALITSVYDEGVVFCPLITKKVINNAGNDLFNMSKGEYVLRNINGRVVVEKV